MSKIHVYTLFRFNAMPCHAVPCRARIGSQMQEVWGSHPTGRVTGRFIPSLRRDKHPAINGHRPSTHCAGHSIRTKHTALSKTKNIVCHKSNLVLARATIAFGDHLSAPIFTLTPFTSSMADEGGGIYVYLSIYRSIYHINNHINNDDMYLCVYIYIYMYVYKHITLPYSHSQRGNRQRRSRTPCTYL